MKRQPDELIPLPLPYDGEDFAEAWANWEAFRKEIRKPITPTIRRVQFQLILKMGKALAIEAITQSINSNWSGLFAPKTHGNGNGSVSTNGAKPDSTWAMTKRLELAESRITEIQSMRTGVWGDIPARFKVEYSDLRKLAKKLRGEILSPERQ